jgi:BirA family biotin operon repressor/biotin-[acetyl-CoA-carboxylase] ligase
MINYIEYDIIDSTQLEAKRLIEANQISTSTCIVTKEQTSGIGRRGSRWSHDSKNLAMSFIVNSHDMDILPFLVAVSIGDITISLSQALSDKIKYKWPNDIMLEGFKIGGILIQRIGNYSIIGIGLNASSPYKNSLSLLDFGVQIEPINLAQKICNEIISNISSVKNYGNAKVINAWNEKCYGYGKMISICEQKSSKSLILRGMKYIKIDNPDHRNQIVSELNNKHSQLNKILCTGKFLGIDRNGNCIIELMSETIIFNTGSLLFL